MSYDVIKSLKITNTGIVATLACNNLVKYNGDLCWETVSKTFAECMYKDKEDAIKNILLHFERGNFHGLPYYKGNYVTGVNKLEQAVIDFCNTPEYEPHTWNAATRDEDALKELLYSYYKAYKNAKPRAIRLAGGLYIQKLTKRRFTTCTELQNAKVYRDTTALKRALMALKFNNYACELIPIYQQSFR